MANFQIVIARNPCEGRGTKQSRQAVNPYIARFLQIGDCFASLAMTLKNAQSAYRRGVLPYARLGAWISAGVYPVLRYGGGVTKGHRDDEAVDWISAFLLMIERGLDSCLRRNDEGMQE